MKTCMCYDLNTDTQTYTHTHTHNGSLGEYEYPRSALQLPASAFLLFLNFLSPPWTSPPGKPLILTDRIHFLTAQGWGRPIVCWCVRVGVRRQMFPSKDFEEGDAVETHILSPKLFFLSHVFPSAQIKSSFLEIHQEAQEEFPQQLNLIVCCFRFYSSLCTQTGFQSGVISLRDDSCTELLSEAAEMINWFMKHFV